MRWLERRIILDIVDTQWKDHLLTLDHLKEGIGLRGYGQKDPLVEFKKEAFTLFEDMMGRIDTETVRYLFLVQPARPEDEAREIERRQRRQQQQLQYQAGAGAGRSAQAGPHRRQSRPQRSLPLRQRQEIQEVPRSRSVAEVRSRQSWNRSSEFARIIRSNPNEKAGTRREELRRIPARKKW